MYAIFKEDLVFRNCPIYELNTETGRFELPGDKEVSYNFLEVVHGEEFILILEDEVEVTATHQ